MRVSKSRSIGCVLGCVLVCQLGLSGRAALAEGRLEVGVARVDITPDLPILLSGYASRGDTEVDRVEQRLFARALAIGGDAEGPAVLLAVENCAVPASVSDAVAHALERDFGIPRARVVVACTHTHSGPMLAGALPNIAAKEISPEKLARVERYTRELIERLVAVSRDALATRAPARVGFALGSVPFGSNRRTPDGPSDHTLPALVVSDPAGGLRAAVVSYACHCTTLPGVPYICGDWAGFASEEFERDHAGSVGLVLIGCAGDQNPDPRGDIEHARRQGRAIADEFGRLLARELRPIEGPLVARFATISLPFAPVPDRAHWEARVGIPGIDGLHARSLLRRLDRDGALPTSLEYPVQTWRLGDALAMVFLGGEVVVDYALRLRRELRADRVWISAYANDVASYIPSERILAEGGYEGGGARVWYDQPAVFQPGLEERIVRAVHEQLDGSFRSVVGARFDVPRDEIDPARTGGVRPSSPEEALAALRTHERLRVELVVAEPLVVDPVAIDWGPDGELWVAEMFDYPLGVDPADYPEGIDGEYAPGGRVRRLTDADGDGRHDTASVFLDRLPFPTGVTAWGRGVLVCAAPDVIFAEDHDGDGRADERRVVLSGFATHNYQARVNSLSLGLDNWIHGASGLFGGRVSNAVGELVDVSDRDFRLSFDLRRLEPLSGRTQQGLARDDRGDWFGCHNGDLLVHHPLDGHAPSRSTRVLSPPAQVSLGRVRLFPPPEIVTYAKSGPPGVPTAACGLAIYRDDLLGPEFSGNAFTCEPVNQLVHRSVLATNGSSFTATRATDESGREFLVSADPWFRPVQARTGPDGALWIVDMCRYVIEHPRWIDAGVRGGLDLRAGDSMGRIYRVLPRGVSPRPLPRLTSLNSRELVAALDSPNGTVRDLVHQAILARKDPGTRAPLESIVERGPHAASRVQALAALDGIGELRVETIVHAIGDSDAGVRRHAVRLSRAFLDRSEVTDRWLDLADERDPQVLRELAITAGESGDSRAAALLAHLAFNDAEDPYLRADILGGVHEDNVEAILAATLGRASELEGSQGFVDALLGLAVSIGSGDALERIVDLLARALAKDRSLERIESLRSVLDSALTSGRALSRVTAARIHAEGRVARDLVLDESLALPLRVASLELAVSAAIAGRDEDLDSLAEICETCLLSRAPLDLQRAAIDVADRLPAAIGAPLLIEALSRVGPGLRDRALDRLVARAEFARRWLETLEARGGAVAIDATRRQRLLAHPDLQLRAMARRVLEGGLDPDRAALVERYLKEIDGQRGQRVRGREVFSKSCANCHRLDGVGHEVGPDLAALTSRTRAGLLVAILDPAREVEGRYAAYTLITRDGRVLSGVLVEETTSSVSLRLVGGEEARILRADVISQARSEGSLMPDALEREISPAAMADLLAYLVATPLASYSYPGPIEPHPSYPDDAAASRLRDGALGSERFDDGSWVGHRHAGERDPLRLELDFGAEESVVGLEIVYGVNHQPGGIHAPVRAQVELRTQDGLLGEPLRFEAFDDTADGLGVYRIARRRAMLSWPATPARFIQLALENDGEWTFLAELRPVLAD